MSETTSTNWTKRGIAGAVLVLMPLMLPGEELVVDFEDVVQEVPPMVAYEGPGGGAYYNGADLAGGFESKGMGFETVYVVDWGSWSGWAYSTTTDTETVGYGNQYSAFPGAAASGAVYALTYAPSELVLPAGWKQPQTISMTNVTYAALSMLEGDAFSKKFGDDTSTADVVETDYPDYFKATLTGLDAYGEPSGQVEVFLADYRGESAADYVLDTWEVVDLSPLGSRVSAIAISLESTDNGAWGMNTPAYLAVDDLVLASTPTWGGYDLLDTGWVDTGAFLGWIYPVGNFSLVSSLNGWVYLSESEAAKETGSWVYFPRP